jgi:hypothetical protein
LLLSRTSAAPKWHVPGPGSYPMIPGISAKGTYFVSSMKSSLASRFLKGLRNSSLCLPARTATPGPGSYRVPSEFGYYEGSVKSETQKRSTGNLHFRPHTEAKHSRGRSAIPASEMTQVLVGNFSSSSLALPPEKRNL